MNSIVSVPCTIHRYDTVYTILDQFSILVSFIACKTNTNAEDSARLFF